jgi:hypothetical protein
MPKKRWQPIPVGAHVMIDGQVSGLVVAPLPKGAGQTYAVRTVGNALSAKLGVHESRLTLRQESKSNP